MRKTKGENAPAKANALDEKQDSAAVKADKICQESELNHL